MAAVPTALLLAQYITPATFFCILVQKQYIPSRSVPFLILRNSRGRLERPYKIFSTRPVSHPCHITHCGRRTVLPPRYWPTQLAQLVTPATFLYILGRKQCIPNRSVPFLFLRNSGGRLERPSEIFPTRLVSHPCHVTHHGWVRRPAANVTHPISHPGNFFSHIRRETVHCE